MLKNINKCSKVCALHITAIPLHQEKFLFNLKIASMNVKAGMLAGAVWNALNENGAMDAKDLKKAAKLKSDKDLYLAMGWLLRDVNLNFVENEKEITLSLK